MPGACATLTTGVRLMHGLPATNEARKKAITDFTPENIEDYENALMKVEHLQTIFLQMKNGYSQAVFGILENWLRKYRIPNIRPGSDTDPGVKIDEITWDVSYEVKVKIKTAESVEIPHILTNVVSLAVDDAPQLYAKNLRASLSGISTHNVKEIKMPNFTHGRINCEGTDALYIPNHIEGEVYAPDATSATLSAHQQGRVVLNKLEGRLELPNFIEGGIEANKVTGLIIPSFQSGYVVAEKATSADLSSWTNGSSGYLPNLQSFSGPLQWLSFRNNRLFDYTVYLDISSAESVCFTHITEEHIKEAERIMKTGSRAEKNAIEPMTNINGKIFNHPKAKPYLERLIKCKLLRCESLRH